MTEVGLYAVVIKFVLLTLVLSQLECLIFGKPRTSQCRTDQAALKDESSGRVVCWDLKKCPDGFGMSFNHTPGNIYPSNLKISCNPCIPGKTYSDTADYSQCKKCTQCKPQEISKGQCNIDKDEIRCTGECQKGFYWSNTTQSCNPCSQCCQTSLCSKSCAQELLKVNCKSESNVTNGTASNNTTGSDGMPEKEQTINYGKDKDKTGKHNKTGKTAIVVISCLILGFALVILIVVYYCSKNPNNRRIMYDQLCFAKSVASSAESMGALVDDTGMVLTSPQGNEIPQKLDDIEGNVEEGNGIYPAEAGNSIPLDKRKVKDLSNEENWKICDMLDKKESFFRDHRLLAEELGMGKEEIDQLINERSPTSCILQKYQEMYMENLGELLTRIGRKDVVRVFHRNSNTHAQDPTLIWEDE